MPTRLVQLVIDATDPARLGRFWAAALGWEVVTEEPDEVEIWPRGYRYPDPVALLGLGAVPADIGQSDVPWQVLADPEGNEFCVLSPR